MAPPGADQPLDRPHYPNSDNRFILVCRFLNILDDAKNCLSPVKLNVWAADLLFIPIAIYDGWPAAMAWLIQAHAAHHFDKRERNLAAVRT